jgi:hypothetical protein
MADGRMAFPIGQHVTLPGHFDRPVLLEEARALGPDGSAGYECRVRLADGRLDEVIISAAEAAALVGLERRDVGGLKPVDAEKLRLLVESTRIRLAYAYDRSSPSASQASARFPTRSRRCTSGCFLSPASGSCWLTIRARARPS